MKSVRRALASEITDRILARFTQKKKLDSLIVKFTPENTDYKPSTFRKVKRNGINYVLDISEYQNWLIYFGIAADDTYPLFKLVKTGDVIIDAGANIGQTTLNCAKLAGPFGKVFGFEPDPVNYNQCELNRSLNNFQTVFFFNYGLGEEASDVTMQLGERNRGGNSIVHNRSDAGKIISIHIKTLDQFTLEMKLEKLSIIKIDVEGYELNVLKGASTTLQRFRPVLYIEVDDAHLKRQSHEPKDIFNILKKYNYLIHDTEGNPISPGKNYTGCHFDIICTPADKLIQ